MYPTKKNCPDDGEESIYTQLQALQTATLAGLKDEGPYQSQSFRPGEESSKMPAPNQSP